VVIDGNQEILSIEIDPELLNPEQKEKLEKGIKEAVNDAMKKIQRTIAMKMQQMGGFNLPGMG
ncbi:YbaB/EbfC family nucleoid-associated protein, partial [Patescibacteria group bacterium]